MLSTCIQPVMLDVVNGQRGFIQKPAAVKQYNLHMDDVDQIDQQFK